MGADVGLHVGKNILDSFPERSYPARIIQLLNEHKRLGEKSGAGFYKYDARRRASADPALGPLVQQSRKVGGVQGGADWVVARRGGTDLHTSPALQPASYSAFSVCVYAPGPLPPPPCRARACTRRVPPPPR